MEIRAVVCGLEREGEVIRALPLVGGEGTVVARVTPFDGDWHGIPVGRGVTGVLVKARDDNGAVAPVEEDAVAEA